MVDRFLNRAHSAEGQAPTDPTAVVWAHVQTARNQKRPHTLELVHAMADEFVELHGDRLYGDDAAIVGGLARIGHLRVAVITGEGGSGGALGLAVGDVVLALENTYYSVITPEGCAAILWRSAEQAQQAALAMKVTAADQAALGVVDRVVPEPGEGAHTDPTETAHRLRDVIVEELATLRRLSLDELIDARYARYRSFGAYAVASPAATPEDRGGLSDRLRGLLATRPSFPTMPSLPSLPGPRRDDPPGRESMPGRDEV